MNIIKISLSAAFLFALVFAAAGEAWGCPTCKDAVAQDPNSANLAQGYGMSIIFMMSMPFLILTGLGSYFYWEVCRAQAALKRKQALEAAALEVPTEEFDAALTGKKECVLDEVEQELVTADG